MGKRLFIGVKIIDSAALLKAYGLIKQSMLNDKIKWVEAYNFHLTLTFLGNTEDKLIPSLKKILEKIVEKYHSFNLILSSFGLFKNIQNPTVLWIGVEKNVTFSELKKDLDKELESIGIKAETREFNPHLTIGRPKFIQDKKVLIELIGKLKNKNIDNQHIAELILFESLPGPVYKVLYSCKLIEN